MRTPALASRPAPCRLQTLRHHSGAYKPFVREVRMRPELEGYDTLATCQVDYEFEEANKVGSQCWGIDCLLAGRHGWVPALGVGGYDTLATCQVGCELEEAKPARWGWRGQGRLQLG